MTIPGAVSEPSSVCFHHRQLTLISVAMAARVVSHILIPVGRVAPVSLRRGRIAVRILPVVERAGAVAGQARTSGCIFVARQIWYLTAIFGALTAYITSIRATTAAQGFVAAATDYMRHLVVITNKSSTKTHLAADPGSLGATGTGRRTRTAAACAHCPGARARACCPRSRRGAYSPCCRHAGVLRSQLDAFLRYQ